MKLVAIASLVLTALVGDLINSVDAAEVIRPAALRPGDTIALVAPASPLDSDRIALVVKRLEAMGFQVQVPDDLFRDNDYLAGSDERRAEELMAAFADPDVDAIFPGTGGYGTTRILDRLDYDVIRRNPKVFVGFSDITALHIAINQRTGLVTFHSPNPEYGLGSEEGLAPMAKRLFWRALLAESYLGSALSVPPHPGYAIEVEPDDGKVLAPKALVAGATEGQLIGGNLSLVHALMGTPFEIDTADQILFLEDVGEAPYRVDRMLQTLKLGGKLDNVAGVVLGSFTRRENEDTEGEVITIDQVLDDFFGRANYPVLARFPVGHQRSNCTLPIGVRVKLDADAGRLVILEDPVQLPVAGDAR